MTLITLMLFGKLTPPLKVTKHLYLFCSQHVRSGLQNVGGKSVVTDSNIHDKVQRVCFKGYAVVGSLHAVETIPSCFHIIKLNTFCVTHNLKSTSNYEMLFSVRSLNLFELVLVQNFSWDRILSLNDGDYST